MSETWCYERDCGMWMPSPYTRGPWSPLHQHGGPPAALLGRVIHDHVNDPSWRTTRMTIEMRRPVPLTPLRVGVETEHAGRRVARRRAVLIDEEGRTLFQALAVQVREVETPTPGTHHREPPPPPEKAPPLMLPHEGERTQYRDLIDLRCARGSWLESPVLAWFRMHHPLVRGTETRGLERVLVAADACSGVGPAVDWRKTSFVNAELTVHLLRDPVDEWVGIDARMDTIAGGVGLSSGAIVDREGIIGRVAQSLVLVPR